MTPQGCWGALLSVEGHRACLAPLPIWATLHPCGREKAAFSLCPCILQRAGLNTQGPLTPAVLCQPAEPGWAGHPEPPCSSQAHMSSGIPESPKPETRLRPARRVCHPAPPSWVITGDFGLSSEAAPPRLCRPARCSLASSCSASSCKAASSARRSERERQGNPGLGGKPNRGSPKLDLDLHRPSHQGRAPRFPGAAGCSGGDARGGMLGEARSHSSALLLGAAGDWRRVTSPLPRRGSRASPSITGYFWLWHKRVPARGP